MKQVCINYESMVEMGPIMPRNQVNMSLLCVASPRLSKTEEGALQYVPIILLKHTNSREILGMRLGANKSLSREF